MAGHPRPQPPRMRSPPEPPVGPLQPPAPQGAPVGPLQPPAPCEPLAGPPSVLLPSFAAAPHRSKPQESPLIAVERPKCPANKNNDKIYQMKQ
jgi:hypothetical protein